MRTRIRILGAVALVAFGYVLGSSGVATPAALQAQNEAEGASEETQGKIRSAYDALNAAMAALEQEQQYTPVMKGVNAFDVLAGGADAKQDLETGRGVDPETFAALYADQATDEIAANISKDEQGRVTYKGKIVRMYSISRLKQMFAKRAALSNPPAEKKK